MTPYGPARAFITKLLRKSPYDEGRRRWREQGRKKPSGPARRRWRIYAIGEKMVM